MRALMVLVSMTSLLGACAAPASSVPKGAVRVESGDDCAMIAAVAREHYRFNDRETVAPPLWLDDENSGWSPRCDWGRYGVQFPLTYDPARPTGWPQWVAFRQPRYDGQGAVVESNIMNGPLAGTGIECRVRSGFAGWTVSECKTMWVS